MKRKGLFCSALLLPLLLGAEGGAWGQEVTVRVGAGVGTGLEMGGSGGSTVVRHSPTFVVLNAGFLLDNDRRVEVGGALLLELEGRVGGGIEPQLRLNTPQKGRLQVALVAGIPLFFAPYTLFGIAAGPALNVKVWRDLSAFGELVFRAYPFGSDLPEGASLFHLDLCLGVRHAF